jgi:chromosomal replication initiation ATPase DnaA
MLQLLKDCWAKTRDELRRRAGEAAFTGWLADLRPVLLERGVVFLEARSRLCADRVRSLFRPLLEEILSQEVGTELHVEIRVAPAASPLETLEVSPARPIVDDGNRTAFLVLKNLAGGRPLPGSLFFFHGPSGVGKTFLLRWWQQSHPQAPVWFDLPGLLRAFQATHRDGRPQDLRAELLVQRPLCLDEFHRVAGKEKLQQMLAAVLRERESMPVPTVMASRWHPREIRDLDASLATLCLAGFVAKVDPPGPMGRLRYLRALEGAPSRNGRATAIEGLAQNLRGSFPELRAAWARARDGQVPAKYLELIDPTRTFQRLRDRVCARLGIAAADLLGKSQSRQLSLARKVLAMLCVQDGLSRAEVGRFLDHRSRAAVSYMTRSLERAMARSPEVRALVEELL